MPGQSLSRNTLSLGHGFCHILSAWAFDKFDHLLPHHILQEVSLDVDMAAAFRFDWILTQSNAGSIVFVYMSRSQLFVTEASKE